MIKKCYPCAAGFFKDIFAIFSSQREKVVTRKNISTITSLESTNSHYLMQLRLPGKFLDFP